MQRAENGQGILENKEEAVGCPLQDFTVFYKTAVLLKRVVLAQELIIGLHSHYELLFI